MFEIVEGTPCFPPGFIKQKKGGKKEEENEVLHD